MARAKVVTLIERKRTGGTVYDVAIDFDDRCKRITVSRDRASGLRFALKHHTGDWQVFDYAGGADTVAIRRMTPEERAAARLRLHSI